MPLGQQAEICETRNVSRGGLLVSCKNHHEVGFPLWVTFPFDPKMPDAQPEALARVVRTKPLVVGTNGIEEIAIHFEGASRAAVAYTQQPANAPPSNGAARVTSVPIRVRPRLIPWHEETMTLEVTPEKVRFMSNREYMQGEVLVVTFVNANGKPWEGTGEIAAEVEKLEKMVGSSSLIVTLKRLN